MNSNNQSFSITPIGGVGEIGSNMACVQNGEQYFFIDCGILFPSDDAFGINYLIPDWHQYIKSPDNNILFITHGHEDHIGAIVHFLTLQPKTKIYAPLFAADLISAKMSIQNIECNIEIYHEGQCLELAGLKVYPIKVNHSIPDTFGVIICDTFENAVTYISDFKFSNKNYLENELNTSYIQNILTNKKFKLALLDSTNIQKKNQTDAELDLVEDIEKIVSEKRRIFITLFSSNVHRMQTIFNAAKKYHKKVIPLGRSMDFYLSISKKNKYLNTYDVLSEFDTIDPQDSNNVFLVSGPQGDFLGALRRLASNEFSGIKLNNNDLFVFSSKTIPGNEKKVSKILNLLTELGTKVVTASDYKIHASGHSGQIDIKKMCEVLNPTHYVPIHGESFLLKYHYEFIKKEYPHINTQLTFNHHTIIINKDHNLQIVPQVNNPPVLIHGDKLPIDRSEISERRKLASQGAVFVSLNVQNKSYKISQSGLPLKTTSIQNELETIVSNFIRNNIISEAGQDEALRIIIRQKLGKKLDYKPIVFVHIHHT